MSLKTTLEPVERVNPFEILRNLNTHALLTAVKKLVDPVGSAIILLNFPFTSL